MAVSEASTFVEQPLDAAREYGGFALLGVVALDHAHAAQRFGQAPGDFGVDLAALAEDRPDLGEGLATARSEDRDEQRGQPGHQRADPQQHHQRDHGGHQAADEFDQAGANQVAHAFDVGHDARDQHAAFVGVVIADRAGARCAAGPSGAARRSGAVRLSREAA